MDFLEFSAIPIGTELDMGLVCSILTDIGAGSWFDAFTVQNTMWLSLVKNIVVSMNSDRVLCGVFGLYPSYVAGILKHVEEINFYVLCNYKLTNAEYIEKAISSEQFTISYVSCEKNYFILSSRGETVLLKSETRMMEAKLPPVLTFTYDLIRNSLLSSLAYAIVFVDNRYLYNKRSADVET